MRALSAFVARAAPDPRRVPLRRHHPGRRRLASAGLAAAALAGALQVLAPDPVPGVAVVVAARDLPAGATLRAGDLRTIHLPGEAVPGGAIAGGALTTATGRVLAGPARRGEVVTDVRLLGAARLAGQPAGTVAAPVRVADPAAAALAAPGSRVDVLLAVQGRTDAEVVVRAATVLAGSTALTASPDLLGGGGDPAAGGLLVLAVSAPDAAALAGAAARGPLSLTLR